MSSNPKSCTCLEVFGEDPNCPLHSYDALEARVEVLEAENARLREALGPFAAFAEFDATGTAYEGQGDDAAILFDHKTERQVTIGHLRAARRVREGGKADG